VQIESEYSRAGALHLLAAFNTRSGEVIGICVTARPRAS
jgi:hypothetical protein